MSATESDGEPRRVRARFATVMVAAACALEAPCAIASFFEPRWAIVATLACAIVALGSFVAAFDGFDAALRRPR